jgi:hypothetical protein
MVVSVLVWHLFRASMISFFFLCFLMFIVFVVFELIQSLMYVLVDHVQ